MDQDPPRAQADLNNQEAELLVCALQSAIAADRAGTQEGSPITGGAGGGGGT